MSNFYSAGAQRPGFKGDLVGVVDAMGSTRPILKRTHMRFTAWKSTLSQKLYDDENV